MGEVSHLPRRWRIALLAGLRLAWMEAGYAYRKYRLLREMTPEERGRR
jgi:hypothetical protein